MPKLQVLLLNYEYPPLGGGAANATRQLLLEFASRPDIVADLVTSSANSRLSVERLSQDITIHRLPVNKREIHYWRQREILAYLSRARKYIATELSPGRYDLAHAFFALPSGLLCYKYRGTIPYIVSLRGSDVPGFNQRLNLQYSFLKPLVRRIWNKSACVIANSEDLKSLALRTNPRQSISVIANGVDTTQFRPLPDSGDNSRPLRILTVSRLTGRKGLDIIIKALPKIVEERDATIEIVGDGNLRNYLQNLAIELGVGDRVTFKGYVPHENLPELYSQADLFVLPSHWEGMSNALLEAMACGLPVIVTNTGGSAALVSKNGCVIEKNTPDSWSEKVVELANDPQTLQEMSRASRSVAQNYSWANVARKYLDIYKEVAKIPSAMDDSRKAVHGLRVSHKG